MLFASIFLSLDFREVLTLDLYHEVTFAKTSKPLQPLVLFFFQYSGWLSKRGRRLLSITQLVSESKVPKPNLELSIYKGLHLGQDDRLNLVPHVVFLIGELHI